MNVVLKYGLEYILLAPTIRTYLAWGAVAGWCGAVVALGLAVCALCAACAVVAESAADFSA